MDPLAEKYAGWSPYNYTLGNPVRFIDLLGLAPSDFYDIEGNHKHIDDNDENAYLVSSSKLKKVKNKSAEDAKKEETTFNLGNNQDVVALANVIFNEARGEANPVKLAIAFTVINRSEISGNSISSEVYKPSQFSGIGKWASLTLENVSPKQRGGLISSYNSAFNAIKMRNSGNNPIGNNVSHFFSPSTSFPYPYWGDPKKEINLPSPYNQGNFIFWKNIAPYIRK